MLSKPTRFLVDVDGVLANFVQGYLDIANPLAGTNYTHDKVTTWELSLLPGFKEVQRQTLETCGRPGWSLSLQVYPGAQEGLKKLAALGEVYIVTSPLWLYSGDVQTKLDIEYAQTFCHDRVRWLEEHFGISRKKIVFASDKHIVDGTVLIDDKPENIQNWIAEHGSKRDTHAAYLWEQPWNAAELGRHPRVQRTNNWAKVAHDWSRFPQKLDASQD